ncbi:MAG: 30S ribosomal protein S8 [Candidatus Lindowbacteria bacterium RIFCSPLOWO2_12_FULL_62_27]|nr:ribosomal protein S8 [uncultured bacterium]OGH59721.1 MAG: 30S ribosomal protein S8 [Candidatus Lindowbacteria bacterium RIFCSPLOWO2_12_FULL_62_27]
MVTDVISDLLLRMRNGCMTRKKTVDVPASRLKVSIIRIMKDEGYIKNYRILKDNKQGILRVYLKYSKDGKSGVIQSLQRISTPGRRVYSPVNRLPRPAGGLGIAIVSTPRGLLTDRECRKEHIGGEVLLEVR